MNASRAVRVQRQFTNTVHTLPQTNWKHAPLSVCCWSISSQFKNAVRLPCFRRNYVLTFAHLRSIFVVTQIGALFCCCRLWLIISMWQRGLKWQTKSEDNANICIFTRCSCMASSYASHIQLQRTCLRWMRSEWKAIMKNPTFQAFWQP